MIALTAYQVMRNQHFLLILIESKSISKRLFLDKKFHCSYSQTHLLPSKFHAAKMCKLCEFFSILQPSGKIIIEENGKCMLSATPTF